VTALFWGAGAVAVISAVQVITRRKPMHALVNLVLLLLAVALMLYTVGAAFVAALQVIIYAGAIIVLFVFAVMLLDLDARQEERERESMQGDAWIAPVILAAALFLLTVYALARPGPTLFGGTVAPKEVGFALFSRYMLGVEMASLLLLAGLVSAFHFGLFLHGSRGRWGSGDGDGNGH
jgi:NADH-quinone oxidoreductase subunit J